MKRRKPLKRANSLKRVSMKRTAIRRRPKRHGWVKGNYRANSVEWDVFYGRKADRCRVCRSPYVSLHHLLSGALRSDELDNLIPLCGSGTTGCHGIYTSRMPGVSADGVTRTWAEVADRIRRSLTRAETLYIVDRIGEAGLDRRYPLAA